MENLPLYLVCVKLHNIYHIYLTPSFPRYRTQIPLSVPLIISPILDSCFHPHCPILFLSVTKTQYILPSPICKVRFIFWYKNYWNLSDSFENRFCLLYHYVYLWLNYQSVGDPFLLTLQNMRDTCISWYQHPQLTASL